MAMYNGKEFTEQQMRMILLGSNNGLNVNSFAKTYYTPEKMSNIIGVLTGKTNRYNGEDYTAEQIKLIKDGLNLELDVDVYANPDFTPEKMDTIMMIMVAESSIDCQHLGEFTLNQLKLIVKGIDEGLKVHLYANPDLDELQMCEVYLGVKSNVNIYEYNNSEYSCEKMRLVRVCLENGIDPIDYITPIDYLQCINDLYHYAVSVGIECGCNQEYLNSDNFTPLQILELVIGCKNGVDVSSWAKPDIPEYEMYKRRSYMKQHGSLDNYISSFEAFFGHNLQQDDLKNQLKNSSVLMRKYAAKYYELCVVNKNTTEELFIKDIRHLKRSLGLDKLNPAIKFGKYSDEQLVFLLKCLLNGLDLGVFANPDYTMEQLTFMLDNLHLANMIKKAYSSEQLEILSKFKDDIKYFEILANPDLTEEHMDILYNDLIEGLKVVSYAKPDMSMVKVKFLSLSQRYGYNPDDYLDFSDEQYQVMIKGLLHRVNIRHFAKPEMSLESMEIIEEALSKRINVGEAFENSDREEAMCELLIKSDEIDLVEEELDEIRSSAKPAEKSVKPAKLAEKSVKPAKSAEKSAKLAEKPDIKVRKARKKVYARKAGARRRV